MLKAVAMAAREESLVKPIIVNGEKREGKKAPVSIGITGRASRPGGEVSGSALSGTGIRREQPLLVTGTEPAAFKAGVVAESPTGDRGAPLRVLGQYLDSYLIAVTEEALFIIDQHNAHERILFEKFNQLERARAWTSKQMLFPPVLELTPKQQVNYQERQPELEGLGVQTGTDGRSQFCPKNTRMFSGGRSSGYSGSLWEMKKKGSLRAGGKR